MEEIVRVKLVEIVTQYGQNVIENPGLVKGLLRDFCGTHRREINCLMDALDEGIAWELRAAGRGGGAATVPLARLTRRLSDDRAMLEDAARWAVESWAMALRVIPTYWWREPVRAPVPAPKPNQAATSMGRDRVVNPGQGVQVVRRAASFTPGAFDPVMVHVPAGEFFRGLRYWNKPIGPDWTSGPCMYTKLDEYWIGKYPVTVAEFRRFVEQTGYHTTAEDKGAEYTWRTTRRKGRHEKGREKHPVVCVSWDDVQAYCQWLSQASGRRYELPNDDEWEKAARGTDGRDYPWGDAEPCIGMCNYGDMWNAGTTSVGKYSPKWDSPYGCADMVGNVWELCLNNHFFWDSRMTRLSIRGGSWKCQESDVRCVSRKYTSLPTGAEDIGFRILSHEAF